MKSPRQFQTRLALALVLSIAGVSGAVLWITSRMVIRHENREFTRQFHAQVDYILNSRDQRSQGIMKQALEFASHPKLRSAFDRPLSSSEKSTLALTFWEGLDLREGGRPNGPSQRPGSGSSRPGGAGRGGPGGAIQAISRFSGVKPVIALVTLDGEVIPLLANEKEGNKLARRKLKLAYHLKEQDLSAVLAKRPQQVTYMAVKPSQGPEVAQEVVVTAVRSPDSQQLLGAILIGVPAETGAERLLDRMQQSIDQSSSLQSGVFLDGQIFTRSIPDEHLEQLVSRLEASIHEDGQWNPDSGHGSAEQAALGEMELKLGEEPYRIHFCPLNPDSDLPIAWQVAAFSLTETHAQLRELLFRGAAVGVFALILALITSFFLSRSLSVPIRELSTATNLIREGDLETRVPVRGRDELADLAHSFNAMADELGQKERFRELLEKVSDEAVAQAMISGELNVQLGGELKDVTVLFCDIRGFTGLTEHMAPDEVIALLNGHMTAMTEIIRESHGVVDKFVGDEIMAVFGALKSYGNDAANAAAAAIRMLQERERLNASLPVPIHLGIGIATGQVVAGCMGSNDRLNYTVLGARVNLASRLCGLAGTGEIIVDETTRQQLDASRFSVSSLPPATLKGFTQSIQAYRLERESPLTAPPAPSPGLAGTPSA